MAYLLDSDVFIEAKRRYYAFDFHPGFWEWLEQANGNGTLYSIDKVKDELLAVDDELAAWARGLTGFFLPIDEAAAASLAVTSAWVNGGGQFNAAAVSEFVEAADYYLVGFAHAHGHTVVTHEVGQLTSKKVKIPNACAGMNVPWVTPYAMLRAAGARFTL